MSADPLEFRFWSWSQRERVGSGPPAGPGSQTASCAGVRRHSQLMFGIQFSEHHQYFPMMHLTFFCINSYLILLPDLMRSHPDSRSRLVFKIFLYCFFRKGTFHQTPETRCGDQTFDMEMKTFYCVTWRRVRMKMVSSCDKASPPPSGVSDSFP